jgi:hypothetical protein
MDVEDVQDVHLKVDGTCGSGFDRAMLKEFDPTE